MRCDEVKLEGMRKVFKEKIHGAKYNFLLILYLKKRKSLIKPFLE